MSTVGTLSRVRKIPNGGRNHWNRLAIASFALGLLPIVPLAGSIVAIFLGSRAENQAQERNERGLGLARWGLWLGIGWLVVLLLFAIAFAFLLSAMSQTIGKMD